MTELDYFKGDELAATTWRKKYALKDERNPAHMHDRLAEEFFRIESKYTWGSNREQYKTWAKLSQYGYDRKDLSRDDIRALFDGFKYIIPAGSVMSGLGTGELVSLSNCFVLDSPEDSYSSIMKTRNYQAQVMKRRGGCGYDLSELRPRGSKVNNAAKTSTGAASFMDVNSDLCRETAQAGRRGALILTMSINHPDVEEFITKKQDLKKVTGANISVKVNDEFMNAVMRSTPYYLRYPVTSKVNITKEVLNLSYGELYSVPGSKQKLKKVDARSLWNTLMRCAHNTAEPGIMFESTMHDYSPDGVYEDMKMISTNPCGKKVLH